ncbi:glycoside hydrolase family 97 catalytic domain-containing protein [Fontisphaera persica]|uniref:glycoside hydrolase family 97 protein n=1 Tax=Fontisphaera persica TaxID=2974023 RepID=UPI0024C02DC5|nr:glycoside hydrolase family 97 protein [Fontisphaera persica]WCJ61137.1 glycoside hydrolase family 97 catalytic domain-containing protein [Fontisphaera persica]
MASRWQVVIGLGLAWFGVLEAAAAAPANWTVSSPNEKIKVVIRLADLGKQRDYPSGRRLYYRVELNGQTVVDDSPLGLTLTDVDLSRNLAVVTALPPKSIEERYAALHGKRRERLHQARQLTLVLRGEKGRALEVDFRASNDGVAFRYRLPERMPLATAMVAAEATGFALPLDGRMWAHPADHVTVYAPAYETYYENEIPIGTPSPITNGWSYPVLFRTANARAWGLITEAALGTNYCGTRLQSQAPQGVYRLRWPAPDEGHNTGSPFPVSTLPWEMPWRVIILGDSLANIVESTLVEDLCPPSALKNTDWVKPGRVAWSWWSDPPSPQDAAKQKQFVDFAAEMGWEYVLVDANWTLMDNGSLGDVLRHAKSKEVGILLWYNSGGPHNIVTEKPRDGFTYREVRRFELEWLKKSGVKGIKVDFFQSDKQNVIQLYHQILQDAADYQILVNFHGCTLPRGWSRTYPHLLSMEAVRGAENYIFTGDFPQRAPVQNTITPFTRNVVGPMDYTPVALTEHNHKHLTTYAHELALAALFESAWVHFADKPEAYRALPAEPKQWLKDLPVAWDDTRLVAGYPGQFIVLARRKGSVWHLAGVNGQNQPREVRLEFGSWLNLAQAELLVMSDGADARTFNVQRLNWQRGQTPVVKMLPYGGLVGTLQQKP